MDYLAFSLCSIVIDSQAVEREFCRYGTAVAGVGGAERRGKAGKVDARFSVAATGKSSIMPVKEYFLPSDRPKSNV